MSPVPSLTYCSLTNCTSASGLWLLTDRGLNRWAHGRTKSNPESDYQARNCDLCPQVGFKFTGRRCIADGCNGRLKDQVLDWEDALPVDELTASEKAAAKADLAICLGTSLQITPACNIPLKTTKAGKRLDKPLCRRTKASGDRSTFQTSQA